MRFCRYCGVPIPDDSLFCPKCGKRLGRRPHPRLDRLVRTLKLNTPYPYFIILLLTVTAALALHRRPAYDYTHLGWSVEAQLRTGPDKDGAYRQTLWLVAENIGTESIQNIPVQLRVGIEPASPVDITANFAGQEIALSQAGKPVPLILMLSDPIGAGSKRKYLLEAAIRARVPFTVSYEFRDEKGKALLARYATEP